MSGMKDYRDSDMYREELLDILQQYEIRKLLQNKVIVVTGARGMIGSELIDTVMLGNQMKIFHCRIYAVVRNMEAAKERFREYLSSDFFRLVQADINADEIQIEEDIDFFIHGASNTHPVYYATRPVETILTNTVGTNHVLSFASEHNCKRFLFLSSVEIYGENRGDIELFDEKCLGYIDSNTLRAGYPEGKRLGEALCQAYIKEKGLDCVIPRISRCYGSGLLDEDSKALSQFLKNALNREDIVLKSEGKQFYSYVYVADVVSALLFLLSKGECGEAYNITGEASDITLADLSKLIADNVGCKVVFDLPNETERAGYSKATKALLDISKIKSLGWKSCYSIEDGIKKTLLLKGMK